ncbi:MAG: type II toxin-antitoxin system VapC family toxin [Actinomycetota bacterium]
MRLFFDTSAVIGLLERRSPRLAELTERATNELLISPITIGELEHGVLVDRGVRPEETLRLAKSSMAHEFFDPIVAPRCWAIIRNSGHPVGINDTWIAATAICGGHRLVTQDARQAGCIDAVDWEATPWKTPDVVYVPVGA